MMKCIANNMGYHANKKTGKELKGGLVLETQWCLNCGCNGLGKYQPKEKKTYPMDSMKKMVAKSNQVTYWACQTHHGAMSTNCIQNVGAILQALI